MATRAPDTRVAWDCATGNGQAAIGLAEHFTNVVATDASPAQLASAIPHERVTYRVAHAAASGIASSSVDIVTVAQAIHWFDRDTFYREAKRVLVHRGVIAVWCYGLLEVDDRIDPLVRRFHEKTVRPYWSPERHLVDEGYRTIEFPFTELVFPSFAIEQPITLDQLGGYLRTWSATRKYAEERGEDPVTPFLDELRQAWGGGPTHARRARWPLAIRAGRYDG